MTPPFATVLASAQHLRQVLYFQLRENPSQCPEPLALLFAARQHKVYIGRVPVLELANHEDELRTYLKATPDVFGLAFASVGQSKFLDGSEDSVLLAAAHVDGESYASAQSFRLSPESEGVRHLILGQEYEHVERARVYADLLKERRV